MNTIFKFLVIIVSISCNAQHLDWLNKKTQQFFYKTIDKRTDTIDYMKLHYNQLSEEKKKDFFKWFFSQNPKQNSFKMNYMFDYFSIDSSLKLYYQGEFSKKLKDTNWTDFINIYRAKILVKPLDSNSELYQSELKFIKSSLKSQKWYSDEDIELIINYNLKEYKSDLEKQLKEVEREYMRTPQNDESIMIAPIHYALSQFGNDTVKELIMQRMEVNKKMYRNKIEVLYNIRTKESYEKLLNLVNIAIKEHKETLNRYYDFEYKLFLRKKKGEKVILKCGNNYSVGELVFNFLSIYNHNIENKRVDEILISNIFLNSFIKDKELEGEFQRQKIEYAKLIVIKENLINQIKDQK